MLLLRVFDARVTILGPNIYTANSYYAMVNKVVALEYVNAVNALVFCRLIFYFRRRVFC